MEENNEEITNQVTNEVTNDVTPQTVKETSKVVATPKPRAPRAPRATTTATPKVATPRAPRAPRAPRPSRAVVKPAVAIPAVEETPEIAITEETIIIVEGKTKKIKNKLTEKEKKANEEAQVAQNNKRECDRARAYLTRLQDGSRISVTEKNGELGLMDDNRRQTEVREVKEVLAKCN